MALKDVKDFVIRYPGHPKYEEGRIIEDDEIEVYEGWLNMFRSEIESFYKRLKMVDDKELFVRDDDVGFVFSEILRVTKEFNDTVK